ncbi:hypothetical protein BC936DRAFT_136972 [Jimgerdemannia flammicorona]|uniref:RWD domain-containing protein n=1 Tax=Jimgerdemannia flammicorona TaxID=994334 RepID=A0A433CYC6_9FUNG|nr:hypothetical protein BC936DRAFT_136972 [Jimgerdemannia flammicorona]
MVTDDDESTNRQLQEDECLALASIFGDSAFVPDTTHPHAHVLTLDLDETQDAPRSPRTLHVRFHFPPTYPSRDPPVHEITSVYCGTMRVTDEMRRAVDAGFRERFVLGEVIVFEWAGWLREYLEERFAEEAHANADRLGDDVAEHEVDENVEEADKEVSLLSTQETAELTSGQGEDAAAPPIAHGEPLVDRRSIFVAHAAPVASLAEVQFDFLCAYGSFVALICPDLPRPAPAPDANPRCQECAGGRDAVVWRSTSIPHSSRVSGIQLGADRFKHINNVARQVLEENGYLAEEGGKKSVVGKKGETTKNKKGKR